MFSKSNRTLWIVVGILGFLMLVPCVACVILFYVGWNLPPPPVTEVISTQNLEKIELVGQFSQRADIQVLAWSPDSRVLVSGGSARRVDFGNLAETLKLWDVVSGHELHTLTGNSADVQSIAFSPDGQLLASASKNEITIWNVTTGKQARVLTDPRQVVRKIAFSGDGRTIYAAEGIDTKDLLGYVSADDLEIESWDVASGRKARVFTGYLGFLPSPDGRILTWTQTANRQSGVADVKVWDLETGRDWWISDVGNRREGNALYPVSFSHDGKVIVWWWKLNFADAPSIDYLSLRDATNGKYLRDLKGNVTPGSCVTFSPDDSLIATTAGATGLFDSSVLKINVWDTQSEKKLQLKAGNGCVAFSPNGHLLAAGGHGTVELWGVR